MNRLTTGGRFSSLASRGSNVNLHPNVGNSYGSHAIRPTGSTKPRCRRLSQPRSDLRPRRTCWNQYPPPKKKSKKESRFGRICDRRPTNSHEHVRLRPDRIGISMPPMGIVNSCTAATTCCNTAMHPCNKLAEAFCRRICHISAKMNIKGVARNILVRIRGRLLSTTVQFFLVRWADARNTPGS